MSWKSLLIAASVAVLAVAAILTRSHWLPLVLPSTRTADHPDREGKHGPIGETNQVKLSTQAQANLRLEVKPLVLDTYWRKIQVPGTIEDRPAQSDRGIVAPATGVITKVHRFPGDNVKPSDLLFTLKLFSESIQLTQSELFKTTQDLETAKEQRKRLAGPVAAGALPETRLVEADNLLRRLLGTTQAYRTDLLTRGLRPDQIDGVAQGKFVSELDILVPKIVGTPAKSAVLSQEDEFVSVFEIQELKVELGQQVQAGQTLCLLSNHQALYIEGRAFRQEAPLVERAARHGWPIQVEFMEEANEWSKLDQPFTIQHIANTIDPVSRTFAFYIPLINESKSIEKGDRTLLLWRFRPGQKVRLHLKVEQIPNVFVLPADAIVREGPEAYVIRQNGDIFERMPVRIVAQDRQQVAIDNDGSVFAGLYVAQNGAAQINRVLKSGSGGLPPGYHMHADGSIHANSSHK